MDLGRSGGGMNEPMSNKQKMSETVMQFEGSF